MHNIFNRNLSTNQFSQMSAASVSAQGEVRFPVYELLPTALLKGLEDAAVAILTSSDIAGDLFNCSRATKVPLSDILPDAIIMVPLFAMENATIMDSTALAVGSMIYIRLDYQPQPHAVFGSCLAYSEGAGDREVQIGARVRFPPPLNFLVAKPPLVDLIVSMSGTEVANLKNGDEPVNKRLCTRLPEEGGEQAGGDQDAHIEKGMTKYILDLDGCKHSTRNKSDIALREKVLGFSFRAIDKERWEYVMGTDFLLQAAEYRVTIMQQGRLRAEHRHKAFTSCGFFDRIQGLPFLQKHSQIELLLTGQVLVEGEVPTLTLEDFVDGDKLSTGMVVCAEQNRPMVFVLKNLQMTLQVYLSSEFEGCFNPFIALLEGVKRPMELVAADFLKYSIEENLRKFFRVVSSERASATSEDAPLTNPGHCATFLSNLFVQLASDLGDHQLRAVEEEYFRMRLVREARITQKSSTSTPLKASTPAKAAERRKESPLRPCAGHLGKQLKAVFPDGRPYKCSYGKACKFRHVGKVGKTPPELLELIAQLPSAAQEDLRKMTKKIA